MRSLFPSWHANNENGHGPAIDAIGALARRKRASSRRYRKTLRLRCLSTTLERACFVYSTVCNLRSDFAHGPKMSARLVHLRTAGRCRSLWRTQNTAAGRHGKCRRHCQFDCHVLEGQAAVDRVIDGGAALVNAVRDRLIEQPPASTLNLTGATRSPRHMSSTSASTAWCAPVCICLYP